MRISREAFGTILFLLSFIVLVLNGPFPETAVAGQQTYDIVLKGGRVIDPETGLDAIRNVGILGDRIVEISEGNILAKQEVDVSGLVVSPGFVDLHVHGMSNQAHEYQARDGVTTALELEGGYAFVREWIESKRGKSLINFGASAAHGEARWLAMKKYATQAADLRKAVVKDGWGSESLGILAAVGRGLNYESLAADEIPGMCRGLRTELEGGALGIGLPIGYYPGATRAESFELYKCAAEMDTVIFTHVRDINIAAIQEAIANAAVNGTSLHIVHLNSMSLGEIDVSLALVKAAQERGMDITTELYPYTAASTSLESSLFDEGWQQRMGISYGDLQWQDTGERLTEATFKSYREKGGVVIIHMMKPDWIERGIRAPFTIIASDGMPYAPGAHPRTAGTFSRVLGRYVREQKVLSLKEAIKKITLMPAQRLEKVAPAAKLKGRIQVGADADITVFDPETIIDTATFEEDLSFSKGVEHVLVNGTFVVKGGKTVEGVNPGRPLMGKYRR
ncbi:MAG: D-glutamate deacylase [Acidobacteria bacterium]|nr:MAG: D-glutamate deacylase [Acidobacteriota bacterium]REK04117.1 MAG: D-glutamate deacylase [Acidobacteriota bacterium]REK15279.1 MAG: D-glutamate deacylase [Acidobacteriota bacterium]REK46369.1 MAG: D-glutamate deacylase [Acidobacteriota bacterium]